MSQYFYLFKNRTFSLFFFGNAVSLFGWGLNFIAVSWIVIDMTGSELMLGKINALATLPGVIIAFYAGTIIDRMNRKHLLVIIDIYRMIAVAIIVLFMWTGVFQLWHLFIMSFLVGLGSSIFWPCAAAFLQELIHEDDYLAGNSLLSASYQSGTLIGSAVGGFVVYAWGASTALLLDALTYLISAILIGAAKHRSANYLKRNERMVETFKNGLGYISKNINIFMYGLSALLADVAIWGCLAVLSIVFSIDILHAGARGFGLIDGAWCRRITINFCSIVDDRCISEEAFTYHGIFHRWHMLDLPDNNSKFGNCNGLVFHNGIAQQFCPNNQSHNSNGEHTQ
jgi:MFS family permease